nr:helix-turn-helix domain-containing protein [Campylobacterota bacterium]
MNRKEIGQSIKDRRKQLNITQVELALLSDLSVRQLSDIETAK